VKNPKYPSTQCDNVGPATETLRLFTFWPVSVFTGKGCLGHDEKLYILRAPSW
jgi:hypothetical protein